VLFRSNGRAALPVFALQRPAVILLLTRLQLNFHENARKKLKLNEKYGIMNVQDKLKAKKLVF